MREKSGLLIETPSQSLDLADYPEENRQDIQAYIQLPNSRRDPPNPPDLKSWLSNHQINEQEFSDRLTNLSENNFMYVSEIISAIANNFYDVSNDKDF